MNNAAAVDERGNYFIMSNHEDNNFIINLISNIEGIKERLQPDSSSVDSLDNLTSKQKEALLSLLDILSSGFEKYSQSDYGCCQNICELEACYDLPAGYSAEQLSALITFSNLGINQIPSNRSIKKWYNSVDNNLAKALSNHYSVRVVDWLFETLGLSKPTNANYEHLTYFLSALILYVVFGDSTILFEALDGFLEEDNLDNVLDSLAKDVFAQDVTSWVDILDSFNESLTANLNEPDKEEYIIEKESVYQVAGWILQDLQDGLNQVQQTDSCSTEYGLKITKLERSFTDKEYSDSYTSSPIPLNFAKQDG